MDLNTTTKLFKKIVAGISIFAIVGLFFIQRAEAVVTYPPSASLGPGDITTSHILNSTILGEDINSNASTTMNKLLVGVFYATSTLSFPNNSISDAFVVDTLTASNYLLHSAYFSTTTHSTLTTIPNLASVGTITTGTWNGTSIADAKVDDNITLTNITQITNRAITDTTGTLTFTRGGTGTTTMTANGALFSDGSNFLQDSGNFIWDDTNNRLGIGTTTPWTTLSVNGQLSVSATTTFNGRELLFPSAKGTSGQFLTTNGAGGLSWTTVAVGTSGGSGTTNVTVLNTTTETDLMNVSIAGGTLGTTGTLTAKLFISILNESNPASNLTINVYYGTTVIATDTFSIGDTGAGAVGNYGYIDAMIVAAGATNAQEGSFTLQTDRRSLGTTAGLRIWGTQNGTAAEDSTAAKVFRITATWAGAATNRSIIMYHYVIDKIN